MFVQVIQGKVKDADLLARQSERWTREIKPGVKGYLGSTTGVTPDGRAITIARFDSPEAAAANSKSEQQTAWWNETAKAYDGDPTFRESTETDTVFGGGSNEAGFVQVIQGKAKDQAALRSQLHSMEEELKSSRPDILGMGIVWHDGGAFTQAVYFRSEDEARKAETATEETDLRRDYMDMFAEPPTFYDLRSPLLD
ncbi:MAG TPA: hypothetical protein VFJ17_06090 [Mycobacteriales bacterium]|jgi:hypothetical protein|nr:hypothetical protein [Mycobacteriales bacterium]